MGKDFNQGRGRGAPRGGARGGRGRGGGRPQQNFNEPPSSIIPVGTVMHPCEEYIILKNSLDERVPIFNRPLYLENKTKIGVIDDVFGPITDFMFSVKCDPGVQPTSFKADQTIYMNPEHFLPMSRFLPKAGGSGGASRGGRGGSRGGNRGGGNFGNRGGGNFRGNQRGGGNFRGNQRGGGNFRGGNRGRGRGN